jgi:hypothetical protein
MPSYLSNVVSFVSGLVRFPGMKEKEGERGRREREK